MEDTDRWRVLYRDGVTWMDEDAPDGHLRGWAEVDAAQVALIQLREADRIVASVLIPEGAQPILFRRRQIAIQVNSTDDTPQEMGRSTVTIIGYRRGDESVWLWRDPAGVVIVSQGELASEQSST